jgi:SAM-dependent methyltransferase
MFDKFLAWYGPTPKTRVLDVGVTCDDSFAESNFFEQWYPYPHNITCVGTEDASHLEQDFPGLTFQRIVAGEPLPFADQSFDLVFSNAVLEHAGDRESQRKFLAEICRVGQAFFVTTPNRWFPVEHHTGVPFLHYLPSPIYRGILRNTRMRYWADEQHLNMLSAASLRDLFPGNTMIEVRSVSLLGFPSNLMAFGRVTRASAASTLPHPELPSRA